MRAVAVVLLLAAWAGAQDTWWPPGTAERWRSIKDEVRTRFPRAAPVTVPELAYAIADGQTPLLLDVRAPAEFAVSHLAGARSSPYGSDPLDTLAGVDRDTDIVVYCSVGWRSGDVTQRLGKLGFRRVRNLEGSVFEWANRGLPMVDDLGPTRLVHGYDRRWGKLVRDALRGEPVAAAEHLQDRVLVCDQSAHRLLLLHTTIPWDSADAVAWSWTAAAATGLPDDHVAWFERPTDARPVDHMRAVLLCAAGGGVALVRVADGQVLWHADAGRDPRAAALLPGGCVVSVSGSDDLLRLHRRQPDAASYDLELAGGHGVVWDHARQCVWALGSGHLLRLRYDQIDRTLHVDRRLPLPADGDRTLHGHDLFPTHDGESLLLSDRHRTLRFDPTGGRFTALPTTVATRAAVTSLDHIAAPHPFLLVRGDGDRDWSHDVLWVSGDGEQVRTLAQGRIHKARFWRPDPFGDGD